MILLLRHYNDSVCDTLASFLGEDIRQLRIESWLGNHKIIHSVGASGAMATFFDKRGDAVLNDDISVIFNRVHSLPLFMPPNTAAEELNYFSSEAAALLWSCLECLGVPVINSPRALGLVGHGVQPVALLRLAASFGVIPCDHLFTTRQRPVRGMLPFGTALPMVDPAGSGAGLFKRAGQGASRIVWAVAGQLLGNLDGLPAGGIRDFTRAAELGFASLAFNRHACGSWRLSAIDPFPVGASESVLACLASELTKLSGSGVRLEAAQ